MLVLAGQLARAAAAPRRNDSRQLPAWSSDGVHIAFDAAEGSRTPRARLDTGGKSDTRVASGALRGWVPQERHLLVQVSGTQTAVVQESAERTTGRAA